MRRWILTAMAMGLLVACGGDEDKPGEMEPVYVECMAPAATITTMEALEAFGSRGCEKLVGFPAELEIRGEAITTLEPLRSLRVLQRLRIEDTNITTLEPLRDVQEVETDVQFDGNSKLSYCQITGWVTLVKTRDPNRDFGVTVDNPAQNDPCSAASYPARGEQ
jgi:hypothetical protein